MSSAAGTRVTGSVGRLTAAEALMRVPAGAGAAGIFFDGENRRPCGPGDFLFVEAAREHRFEEFTDDFATWVLFYRPEGGEEGSARPPDSGSPR